MLLPHVAELQKALDELDKGHQPQAHESDAQSAKMSEKMNRLREIWGNDNVSLSQTFMFRRRWRELKRVRFILQHWSLRWIVVAHPKAEPLLSRAHADFL